LQPIKTHLRRLLELAVMFCWTVGLSLLVPAWAKSGQVTGHQHEEAGTSLASVPLQPLAQQVRRLEDTLSFLGQPLPAKAHQAINQAIASPDEGAAVAALQNAIDPFVLITIDINPESRVKVERGPADPSLVQGGSRFFLLKVLNHAGVTAPLTVSSPNSGRVFIRSTGDPAPQMTLTNADVRDRWADISIFNAPPASKTLSGLAVEYRVLEVFSRDTGQRSADIGFNVGQGTQDIGFRNDVQIVFRADAARRIKLHLLDENGHPTMMSLTIRDRWNRLYPSPSKRLAPDLFFQPQIYRQDGEFVDLPPGYYTITTTGGPEYRAHAKEFAVDSNGPNELSFQLDRWIDPSRYRCYSGDHHVHAAGCSHYQNPAEGVLPKDMMRQIEGEKLNFGAVLTWGPDYYYQKQFFSGKDDPLSSTSEKMHYDLEVSGFPSSHAGHIVLLGLKDQDYPNTKRIEDWPTWDLPVLQWAKNQGALTGFAHSGWGLQVADRTLPSFQMPGFDGIGANEYVVDVTYPNTIDFISAGDTPFVWELSAWYHTLNVGFRTRISGETDFPCITDERVGSGRSYVKLNDSAISYKAWLHGLKEGASYVSEGRAHLMDFSLNGTEVGTSDSQISLSSEGTVHASVRVAALLDTNPHPEIQSLPYDQKPYWAIERARIGTTREVPVELVVNGKVVATKQVLADGSVHEVSFDTVIGQSSWVAARILPAAHTNPMFVLVNNKPVRASRESAEWLANAVHQCWTQKSPKIAAAEQAAARTAYDHAETVYKRLEVECTP
jgi:hypothetical protein